MTVHIDKVGATLRRHATYLPDVLRDDLARAFARDGVAHEDYDGGHAVHASAAGTPLTPSSGVTKLARLAAAMADPNKSVPARFAYNALKRHGVDLNIIDTDPVWISLGMKAAGVGEDDRLAVKVALHRAGVLA